MKRARPPQSLAPLLAAFREYIEKRDERTALPPLELPRDSSLARLRDRFDLAPFEVAVVGCAAAVELVPGFGRSCAAALGESAPSAVTVGLAIAKLPAPHWDAFAPEGTLRRWRLIHLGDGDVFTGRTVTLPEPVLHFLLGSPALDDELRARLRVVQPGTALPPSRRALAETIERTLRGSQAPHLQVVAPHVDQTRALLAEVARSLGRTLWELPAWAIPDSAQDREEFLWTCARDARLCDSLLLLDVSASAEPTHARYASELTSRAPDPIVICGPEVLRPAGRAVVSVPLSRLPHDEAVALWKNALDKFPDGPQVDVAAIAAQFHLGPEDIVSAARSALHLMNGPPEGGPYAGAPEGGPNDGPDRAIWRACRLIARVRLDDLAQRIEPEADWTRLVLPEEEIRTLRAIAAQVRFRARVFHEWGFSTQNIRGGGTSAIFSGPSGTGKTMAAEVLARELELDLYRIDLSAVVSKYIGETEKNLRRVFDAAEESGAILLFDEADALFGKRTEVKDSHDRHANIEVSYLLQRMESYQGLAILTTNLRKNIDDAFLRRIQFIVEFPFPDADLRERIWRGIFPAQAPLHEVDTRQLARLAVAGGNIKNIARNAAYLAAAEDRPVCMAHLLDAARREYAKIGQALTAPEIRGWVS